MTLIKDTFSPASRLDPGGSGVETQLSYAEISRRLHGALIESCLAKD